MKKRILLLLLMMALWPLSNVRMMAQTITFNVGYVDPSINQDYPRSPILTPEVEIDGFTLTFYTPCDGCTLRLLDENDTVVYSTVIPTGTTSLVLPSYLSGEFEIQILQGTLCFWGYIYL